MYRIKIKPDTGGYEMTVEAEDAEAAAQFVTRQLALSAVQPGSASPPATRPAETSQANAPPPPLTLSGERICGGVVFRNGRFTSPSGVSQADRVEDALERIGRPAFTPDIVDAIEEPWEMTANTVRPLVEVIRQVVSRGSRFVRLIDGRYALDKWVGTQVDPRLVSPDKVEAPRRKSVPTPNEVQLRIG